ncbi:MAG: IS5/IS1182 family transposase, partial [Methylocella sp.]
MWTTANRAKYNRDHRSYPSGLTGEEGAHGEPLIPPARPGGGAREVAAQAGLNGVMYGLSAGVSGVTS